MDFAFEALVFTLLPQALLGRCSVDTRRRLGRSHISKAVRSNIATAQRGRVAVSMDLQATSLAVHPDAPGNDEPVDRARGADDLDLGEGCED